MMLINALGISREYASAVVIPGDTVIDETCGKCRDTFLLAGLVHENGHVFTFDIRKNLYYSLKN